MHAQILSNGSEQLLGVVQTGKKDKGFTENNCKPFIHLSRPREFEPRTYELEALTNYLSKIVPQL